MKSTKRVSIEIPERYRAALRRECNLHRLDPGELAAILLLHAIDVGDRELWREWVRHANTLREHGRYEPLEESRAEAVA